jgi:hypothetical protein
MFVCSMRSTAAEPGKLPRVNVVLHGSLLVTTDGLSLGQSLRLETEPQYDLDPFAFA